MANATERRRIRGQWVTFEPVDAKILRQAKAVDTARRFGMVDPMVGKKKARGKAPGHRSITRVRQGFIAIRAAQEKYGPNA